MDGVDWERAFAGLSVDDEFLSYLNVLSIVFLTSCPTGIITGMILEKAKIYKRYVRNGRNQVDSQALVKSLLDVNWLLRPKTVILQDFAIL